jgi:hypothetical protein
MHSNVCIDHYDLFHIGGCLYNQNYNLCSAFTEQRRINPACMIRRDICGILSSYILAVVCCHKIDKIEVRLVGVFSSSLEAVITLTSFHLCRLIFVQLVSSENFAFSAL